MTAASQSVPRCSICGQPRYQKHMEYCAGPPQRIAPPVVREGCGCNSGGMHEPDCVLVTEGEK